MDKYTYHINPMTLAIVTIAISAVWIMFLDPSGYSVNPVVIGVILLVFDAYLALAYIVNNR
jgi:hypothetical protein